ncbi:unnamed protein product [Ceutorhynchus assimilis]|uniref:Glycoprotein n=1 Tax=Ceutorhynchus assimilis TaxID=467358 RepID=A0A9P0DLT5_9CUCU|nr:unnamed protein product [Ceutorhynchus assimilis]
MKTTFIVLSALCAVLLVQCDDSPHHIDQRILEKRNETGTVLPDDAQSNSTTLSTTKEFTSTTQTPQEASTVSPIQTSTKFNVTSLLRKKLGQELGGQQDELVDDSLKVVPLRSEHNDTIDAEVKDLLEDDLPIKQSILEQHQHPLEPIEPVPIPDKIDKQVELIEDGENTEDMLRRHRKENLMESVEGIQKIERLPNTPIAIIFVTMFVALSIICYAGLLVYRKYLENRYGSRTLLVDADELAHPNDMRHFTI